jgi:hypothetical protein
VDSTVTDGDSDIIAAVQDLDKSTAGMTGHVIRQTSFTIYDDFGGFTVTVDTTNNQFTIVTGTAGEKLSHFTLIKLEVSGTGSLSVAKAVQTAGAPAATFPITVAFTGAGIENIVCAGYTNNAGTFNITLPGGDAAVFTNIPIGAEYTITEDLTGLAGWTNMTGQITGSITDTSTVYRTVTNAYDPGTGSLSVTKAVQTADAPAAAFPITVAFTGAGSENIVCAGYTNNSGMFNITLPGGDAAVFTNIPFGVSYTVTENLTQAQIGAGWINLGNDASGTITLENRSDDVTIYNIYAPDYGSLSVSKNVSGTGASASEKFTVTVQFTPGQYGSLNDIVFSGGATSGTGTYVLSLSDDESAVFTHIPMGTGYVITETLTSAQTGAGWAAPGSKAGTITGTQMVYETVENVFAPDYGSLSVSKNVSGTGASTTERFTVIVQFTPGRYGSLNDIVYSGGPARGSGRYVLSLSDGEYVTFTNIPFGTSYVITESLTPAQENAGWIAPENISGTITGTAPRFETVENVFAPRYGSLYVEKIVSGDDPSTTERFTVTVQFTPGRYGSLNDIAFSGGTATGYGTYVVSLAGGESAHFTNIPLGTAYAVTEILTADQEDDGWSGPAGAFTGTISGTALVGVTIQNTYTESGEVAGDVDKPDDLPYVGGYGPVFFMLVAGSALIAAGAIAFVISKKRGQGGAER